MSEWVKSGRICPTCDQTGPHLLVDGTLYCGTCDNKIPD